RHRFRRMCASVRNGARAPLWRVPATSAASRHHANAIQPVAVHPRGGTTAGSVGREFAMSLALVHSRALRGLEAPAVTVEVHLANGLPSFTLVGLADTEVKEARERVRAALQTERARVSAQQAQTVSLAPADLLKES